MEYIHIDKLIPHPKNEYFFDDIEGEPWADFVDSIRDSKGPYDPIVITPDYVIVSGHQRVRACKLLGINEVQCTTRHFDNDDMVLKALIETNIRQRGIGNPNPVKFGRCILELERIYGIKHGGDHGNQYTGGNSTIGGIGKTQDDLLNEIGIDKESYRRYKKLAKLPEDIQQAVCDGVITQSVASRLIAKLPLEDQEELAKKIITEDSVSTKQIEEYVKQINETKNENNKLRKIISENESKNITEKNELQRQIDELKDNPRIPDDYDDLKKKAKLISSYENDYKREREKVNEEKRKNLELQNKIDELKLQTAQATTSAKLIEGSIYFVAQCGSFVRDMGGYIWIADKIAELPDGERVNFVKAVKAIHDWAEILQQNIERNM